MKNTGFPRFRPVRLVRSCIAAAARCCRSAAELLRGKRSSQASLAMITTLAMTPAAAPAESRQDQRRVTFDASSSINYLPFAQRNPNQPFRFSSIDAEGDQVHFISDIGTTFRVWLSPDSDMRRSAPDRRALAMSITADHDQNIKDKIMLDVVNFMSDDALRFGDNQPRFFSFRFKLDPAFDVPNGWLLITQAWQCCSGHPPLSVQVRPGKDRRGPVRLFFDVLDDRTEEASYGHGKDLSEIVVQRGVWNELTMELLPSPDNGSRTGLIAAWLNRRKLFEFNGPWGFALSEHSESTHGREVDGIGIDLGLYRRRQSTTQTIYYDDIRWSRSPPEGIQ